MLDMGIPERDRNATNIELEKLFVLLESTAEYKAEEAEKIEEKRRINEPIDKKAHERMILKYSEGTLATDAGVKARFTSIPALKLILNDKAEIIKKHANDWKFLTISELTAEEMRAIRSNLPNFGRHQIRQTAWVKQLENRIDRVESGAEKVQAIPKGGPARLDNAGFLQASTKIPPPPMAAIPLRSSRKLRTTSNDPPKVNQVGIFSQINNKGFTLKKVAFPNKEGGGSEKNKIDG